MHKLLFIICFVCTQQNDWWKETEKSVAAIDQNAVLLDTRVVQEPGVKLTVSFYEAGKVKKTMATFDEAEFAAMDFIFYKEKGLIFSEVKSGKIYFINKGARLDTDPIGKFVESKTYFKNETEGINFLREVLMYKGDRIDDARKQLQTLAFETKTLTEADYHKMRVKFKGMTTFEK